MYQQFFLELLLHHARDFVLSHFATLTEHEPTHMFVRADLLATLCPSTRTNKTSGGSSESGRACRKTGARPYRSLGPKCTPKMGHEKAGTSRGNIAAARAQLYSTGSCTEG